MHRLKTNMSQTKPIIMAQADIKNIILPNQFRTNTSVQHKRSASKSLKSKSALNYSQTTSMNQDE
jgi:hypothetical protein